MIVSAVGQCESAVCIHYAPSLLSLPLSLPPLPTLQVITEHRAELPALQSSCPLARCLHTVAHTSVPRPPFARPRLPPIHAAILYVCVPIPALQICSSVPFFRFHTLPVFLSLTYFTVCMTVSRPIYISTNDPVSFLFVAEYYSIVYLYHIFFSIHLSLDI